MQKLFWQAIKVAPAILGAVLVISGSPVVAQTETTKESELLDQINNYSEEGDSQSQVTNVTQLRDVAPTDWAYEALRSVVERYGCIEGYPDQTYRGNRALTRYEFAAGLNSCLNSIERLIVKRLVPSAGSRLSYLRELEEAYEKGWLLNTSEVASLLRLSSKTVCAYGEEFEDAGFVFTRAGIRKGGEIAWAVDKKPLAEAITPSLLGGIGVKEAFSDEFDPEAE